MFNLPSITGTYNAIADFSSHNSFSYCQLVTHASNDDSILITTDGSCVSAFEVIGVTCFLTEETELEYINTLTEELSTVLRDPHHKIGINYTRDQNRTSYELDQIFDSTMQTINRLGINAAHFFEDQKRDLANNCAYERCILTITTNHKAVKRETINPQFVNGERVIIDEMPPLIQNKMKESEQVIQAHNAFKKQIENSFNKSLNIKAMTSDDLLLVIKEEEELTPLTHTRWRTKRYGDPVDLTINDNEEDFINYPPLAYQIVTNPKQRTKQDNNIIEGNSKFIAPIDREFFPIKPEPFSNLLESIPLNIPIRLNFDFETGTENIKSSLSSRKTWLMFFLFSQQGKHIDAAINSLIYSVEKENETLLAGTLSIATWASNIDLCRQYKKDVTQAVMSWGAQETKTPNNVHAGYYSTLPAYSKKPASRKCVQNLRRHLTTLPLTRPAAPMDMGGICMSTPDGRLVPIDPATTKQNYSANVITGGMGAGKTVFSSCFNNTFVFGNGNEVLPQIAYLDFGTGVHNYCGSLRNWLSKEQQYLVEVLKLTNEKGNAFNILEPQFGLEQLEEQESSFCTAFLSRAVNGTSDMPVHSQLSTVVSRIINELFNYYRNSPLRYETRIANYHKDEYRLHEEINELLSDGIVSFDASEVAGWYKLRDKLYQLGSAYINHARFCHRQGSPNLTHLVNLIRTSSNLRVSLSGYTMDNTGTPLAEYIATVLTGLISRFEHVLGTASAIDVSQARVIGVDLKGIGGTGNDPDTLNTKRIFALLGKYITTRNFWRDPDTFLHIVPPLYQEMYEKIIRVDETIKKHDFIDEYKQMKSDEMDGILDNTVLIARKYGLCMTISSQSLTHMPDNFLTLATNIYCLTLSKQEAAIMKKMYALSDSFLGDAMKQAGSSNGFGFNLVYIGKFKKISGYVVQILRNYITPSYLWNFASGAEDEKIKRLARLSFGESEAFKRLSKAFPDGTADSVISARVSNSKYDTTPLTKEQVIVSLVKEMESLG